MNRNEWIVAGIAGAAVSYFVLRPKASVAASGPAPDSSSPTARRRVLGRAPRYGSPNLPNAVAGTMTSTTAMNTPRDTDALSSWRPGQPIPAGYFVSLDRLILDTPANRSLIS